MNDLIRSAVVLSRPTAADVLDPDTGAVVLSGHPSTGAAWDDTPMDKWSQHVRKTDGLMLHALRIGADLWLVVQREPAGNEALVELAALPSNVYGASLKDTWIAARLGPGPARGIMRRWPDWKVSGFVRDSETGDPVAVTRDERAIFSRDSDAVLPSTLFGGAGPWHLDAVGALVPHLDPAEALHVTKWHRPALTLVVAGYADATPEAGTPED